MRHAPAFILTLESIFQRTVAAMQTADQQAKDLSKDLGALTGCEYDRVKWSPCTLVRELEEEAKNIAHLITSYAIKRLSTPDAPLELEASEFLRPYTHAEKRIRRQLRDYDNPLSWEEGERRIIAVWSRFSPIKVWRRIERAYPPERAVALAAARGASTIVSTFHLNAARPMHEVKGRIELAATVYSRTHRGTYQLTPGDTARLSGALEGIRIALAQAGDDASANSLAGGFSALRIMERGYASRARYEMGAGMVLTAFKDQVKLSLPPELASQINTFVSLHAADVLRRAPRF